MTRVPARAIRGALAATILTIGVTPLTLGAQAAAPPTIRTQQHPATPVWARYDRATRTAHLTLISSYGADTYNFNGGTRGRFTFTVPLGAQVIVTYSNRSMHMPPRRPRSRERRLRTTAMERRWAWSRPSLSWPTRLAATC